MTITIDKARLGAEVQSLSEACIDLQGCDVIPYYSSSSDSDIISFSRSIRGINSTSKGAACATIVSEKLFGSIGASGRSTMRNDQSKSARLMYSDLFATCRPGHTLDVLVSIDLDDGQTLPSAKAIRERGYVSSELTIVVNPSLGIKFLRIGKGLGVSRYSPRCTV